MGVQLSADTDRAERGNKMLTFLSLSSVLSDMTAFREATKNFPKPQGIIYLGGKLKAICRSKDFFRGTLLRFLPFLPVLLVLAVPGQQR